MTRNEIYDVWRRNGVKANGEFSRDDEVQRAYKDWCAAGAPKNCAVSMVRGADRELVLIDTAEPQEAFPEGGIEL